MTKRKSGYERVLNENTGKNTNEKIKPQNANHVPSAPVAGVSGVSWSISTASGGSPSASVLCPDADHEI